MPLRPNPNSSNQTTKTPQIDHWRHIIQQKIYCPQSDANCWKKLLPQLPCQLSDSNCWKHTYPAIPCSDNDLNCWKTLLPQLPCQLKDEKCWRQFKHSSYKDYVSFKQITPQTLGNTMINDTESIWLI